jgi:hypothetical protein
MKTSIPVGSHLLTSLLPLYFAIHTATTPRFCLHTSIPSERMTNIRDEIIGIGLSVRISGIVSLMYRKAMIESRESIRTTAVRISEGYRFLLVLSSKVTKATPARKNSTAVSTAILADRGSSSLYHYFRTMNDAAGENLNWFWKGWFVKNYKLDQAVDSVRYVDGDPAKGSLITLGNKDQMVMPTAVEVKESNGKTGTINLPVEILERGGSFTFFYHSITPIDSVIVDPNEVLPDVNPSNNVWTGK